MKRRSLSIILTLAMLLSMLPAAVFASGEVSSLPGAGTEGEPYTIETLEELKWFRDQVNAGNDYDGKFVQLTANIDLGGSAENPWEPIGYYNDTPASEPANSDRDHLSYGFKGTFDGNGKTISNLYVSGAGKNDQGFFGFTSVVKNLTIHNATVTGAMHVGAITGCAENSVSKIENCHVTGTIRITGENSVGGIIGYGYTTTTGCSVNGAAGSLIMGAAGNVEEGDNVGGIQGHYSDGRFVMSGCSVKNVTVAGTRKVGGLVGTTTRYNNIKNCTVENVTVECTASAEYANSNSSTTTIGGLIGNYFGGGSGGEVSGNTVKNVTFTVGNAKSAGAIVGGDRTNAGNEPVGVTAVNNTVTNVTGATNTYLLGEAQSGGVCYPTLSAAIAAARPGDTVTLLRDVELSSAVRVEADDKIILDLNGHDIDALEESRIAIISYGDLTLTDSVGGGVVKAGQSNAYGEGKHGGNTINVCGGTFLMEGGSIYSLNNGILIDEQAATVTIRGGVITAEPTTDNSAAFYISSKAGVVLNIEGGEMIGFNGILHWNNVEINISAGTITGRNDLGIQGNGTMDNTEINISGGSVSGAEAAIYHPQGGALNISGTAVLTGGTGIVVKGGTVNVSGGSIIANGEAGHYTPNGNGFNGTGDALYVEHFDNSTESRYYGTPVVTVTGGTFTSANGKAVASYANADNSVQALAGFIAGGTFSTEVDAELLAAGCVMAETEGGYAVVKNEAKVTYVTNGGSSVSSETIDLAEKQHFTKPSNPRRSGYTFKGWYCEAELENLYNFEESFPAAGDDMVLYAKWKKKASPAPTPTPDPEPEITQPEAPKVDTTPDTSSPTVNEEVKENSDGTTTKTETKEDGTTVETTTGTDGSSTTTASKTETKENADGSTTTSTATNTTTTTATGDKVTEEKVEEVVKTETSTTTTTATKTETETATGDKVTQEKVEAKVENADGSATTTTSTKTETTTAAGEKVTEEKKEEVKANTDGSVATTTATKTETTTATGEKVTEQTVEEKVENTDGSATTTTTTVTQSENKTETTKAIETVTVDENGEQTVTTQSQTDTALSNGSTGTTTVSEDGSVKAEVTVTTAAVAQTAKDETVALPMPEIPASSQTETAAVVEVKIPAAAVVEIPVEDVSAGAVAIIVHADGTEELVKDSYVTENGVAVGVEGDAVIKIVDNSKEFDDVSEDQWFHDAADFMSARGLMSGTAEGRFSPDQDSSRAMVWTMMASLNNAETTGGATWFEKSQDWAKENGISDGTDPDGSIAREQLAVMLWRQAGSPASDRSFADFNDADSISGWAEEAMRWALENGIMGGKGNGVLDPKGNASRGEVAQMFKNFVRYTAHN